MSHRTRSRPYCITRGLTDSYTFVREGFTETHEALHVTFTLVCQYDGISIESTRLTLKEDAMTVGKKLTIALALAIPLLILGSGLAMAAGDEPNLTIGEKYTAPAYAVAPVSTAAITAPAWGGCAGPCQNSDGKLCAGNCNGECDQDCDGDCAVSGSCIGQCSGGANCGGALAQPEGRSCRGGGCGQRLGALSDSTPACTSCDVAGLNLEKPCLPARSTTSA